MIRVTVVALCVFCFAAGCAKAPSKPAFRTIVTFAAGEVKISRNGSEIAAVPNVEVFETDIIKTGAKSKGVLQVADLDLICLS